MVLSHSQEDTSNVSFESNERTRPSLSPSSLSITMETTQQLISLAISPSPSSPPPPPPHPSNLTITPPHVTVIPPPPPLPLHLTFPHTLPNVPATPATPPPPPPPPLPLHLTFPHPHVTPQQLTSVIPPPPHPLQIATQPPPPPPAIPVAPPLPPIFQRVTQPKESKNTTAIKQIMNELKEMNTLSFAEDQLSVEINQDDPLQIAVIVTPNDGLYRDGYFKFLITFPPTYPAGRPKITCQTPIFHPNISTTGSICFSLLQDVAENRTLRIADYAHGLLWLLYYPNLFSRLNSDCPQNEVLFRKLARTCVEGGTFKSGSSYTFSRSEKLMQSESEKSNQKEDESDKNKGWEWVLIGEEWQQVFKEVKK
jgi:ubiquitin-protein ligase